ncbi:MAG: hypothetical protein NTZ73_02645 [Candidatus Diapherotrites archaeon]|nr:hypothetical protein [Candidatus Diapherotrites archaeon]
MEKYNTAFFTLYTNLFKILKEEFGEEKALEVFTQIMERGLKSAYDSMGFEKGSTKDFAKVLKARDESVGLKVSFPMVTKNKVVYRFHTNAFPNLKGEVSPEKLDATFMRFKVNYLLGDDWGYKTTNHIWRGGRFTDHIIERRKK